MKMVSQVSTSNILLESWWF